MDIDFVFLCRDSAKLAIAFLLRASSILEQAQMALGLASVHASMALYSLLHRFYDDQGRITNLRNNGVTEM